MNQDWCQVTGYVVRIGDRYHFYSDNGLRIFLPHVQRTSHIDGQQNVFSCYADTEVYTGKDLPLYKPEEGAKVRANLNYERGSLKSSGWSLYAQDGYMEWTVKDKDSYSLEVMMPRAKIGQLVEGKVYKIAV